MVQNVFISLTHLKGKDKKNVNVSTKKKKKKVNERVREEPFLDYSKEWSVLQNNLEIELFVFFDNLSSSFQLFIHSGWSSDLCFLEGVPGGPSTRRLRAELGVTSSPSAVRSGAGAGAGAGAPFSSSDSFSSHSSDARRSFDVARDFLHKIQTHTKNKYKSDHKQKKKERKLCVPSRSAFHPVSFGSLLSDNAVHRPMQSERPKPVANKMLSHKKRKEEKKKKKIEPLLFSKVNG